MQPIPKSFSSKPAYGEASFESVSQSEFSCRLGSNDESSHPEFFVLACSSLDLQLGSHAFEELESWKLVCLEYFLIF